MTDAAGVATASDAVDGFTYWLWTGGTETQACLELAQQLRCTTPVTPTPEHRSEVPTTGRAQGEGDVVSLARAECRRHNTVICAETEEFRQLARALPSKGWFCVDM